MRPNMSAKSLSSASRSFLSVACCFLIIMVLWLGVCLDNSYAALPGVRVAGVVGALGGAIASRPNILEDLKSKVKDDLAGNSDSAVVGNSDSAGSDVESEKEQPDRNFDNSASQIKSTGNEVDGRTDENVAKIQGKAVNSGDEVENVIENVMSNIKDKVN